MHPVRITGEKVVLREFRQDDFDAVLAIVGDDRVTTWLSFDKRDADETTAMLRAITDRARHEPRAEFYLAIVRPDDDQVVGFARLARDGIQAAKLGYAVAADHWGRGYATEAAVLLVAFGFEQLGLHRISAAIGPDNQASTTVAERLGMSYEGRIRHHVRTRTGWRDSLLYSVLADEWVRTGRPGRAQDWGHDAAG